jgi:hypothetical protein
MFKYYCYILFIVVLGLFGGCGKERYHRNFVLRNSSVTGLDFQNNLTENSDFNILNYPYYYNGGGVSVGDINNDGLDDIFFTSNLESNRLFLNKGDLEFEDITEKAGVGGQYDWSTGCTMVDINGDGFLDIYVCNLGNYQGKTGKNELFLNNGDGTFTEAASTYGLDFSTFSSQALFFDYDRDGDLDMYLLNHAIHTINSYVSRNKIMNKFDTMSGDRLLRNNLDKGELTFTDVTFDAGIQSSPVGFGLGVSASDINNDGWPDLYISNDFHENDYLYINNGDGTFNDVHSKWIGHSSKYSMGNDINDVNNDGLPDIITLDMLPELPEVLQKSMAEDDYNLREIILNKGYAPQLSRNTLQLNRNGIFSDVAPIMGVSATDWSWSPLFADLNNDGYKDLYITNGIYRRPNDLDYLNYTSNNAVRSIIDLKDSLMSQRLIALMPQLKISNKAYINKNGQYFEDITNNWGLKIPSYSNGAAYSDLDNDGDLELIVNNINENAFLFENKINEKQPDQTYLKIALKGKDFNSMGIGTKVIIKNKGKTYYQEQYPVRGFLSSVSQILHFGLGTLKQVDSLWVIWPEGSYQFLDNVNIGQILTVDEGDASGDYYSKTIHIEESKRFFHNLDTVPFQYSHQENDFNEVFRENFIPRRFSSEGPGIAIGDVNNDGLDDVFLTNAQNFKDRLFIQQKSSSFYEMHQEAFEKDSLYEGVAAIFFDADGDSNLDLYVASAGNEYKNGESPLIDRLYLNDGKGNFTRKKDGLPKIFANSSCVIPADYDKDGDIDLFIGSRVITSNYGVSPKSYLLQNDGYGNFTEVPLPKEIAYMGMVTDAVWVDFDADGWLDLAVVGEWMPITFIKNQKGKFTTSSLSSIGKTNGWWNCIISGDFDNDGDIDLVAGNVGLNTRLKATHDEPVRLYLKDFDNNGSLDQIMTYYVDGKEYPLATKDKLSSQLNFLKKKFPTYNSFSGTTLEKLLSREQLDGAIIKEAYELQSIYIENIGDSKFNTHALPIEANFSPVMSIESKDINKDGLKDIILAGNFYGFMPGVGRQDASQGYLLLNGGNNSFSTVEHTKSGILLEGEVKEMKWIRLANWREGLIIARNNEDILILELKK